MLLLFTVFYLAPKGLVSAISLPIASQIPALTEAITVDPSGCLGGVTQFSGCKALYSTYNDCNGKGKETDFVSCLCKQSVFNNIFDCKNELRLCDETLIYDNSFEIPIHEWHSICDSHVDSTITTPALSSLTATFDPQACNDLYVACESAITLKSICKASATAELQLLSCMCQPQITSLYSLCYYDGNVSCVMEPGNTESIPGRSFCQYFHTASLSINPSEISSAISMFNFSSLTFGQESVTSSSISLSFGYTVTAKPTIPVATASVTSTSQQSAAFEVRTGHSFAIGLLWILTLCLIHWNLYQY